MVATSFMPFVTLLTKPALGLLHFLHGVCAKLLQGGLLVFEIAVKDIPFGDLEMWRIQAVHVLETNNLIMMTWRQTLHGVGEHGITVSQLGSLVNTFE